MEDKFKNENFSEDNLSDMSDIGNLAEEDKNDKTKKIMFGAVIFAVLLVIIFVIVTSFGSDETENSDTAMEFLDESEPFFMDSPADTLDPVDSNPESPKDDDTFSKESLIGETTDYNSFGDEEESEDPVVSSIQPSTIEPMRPSVEEPTMDRDVAPESTPDRYEPTPPAPAVQKEEIKAPVNNNPKELVGVKQVYIQTGTFLKYYPNKRYLKKIEDLGLPYYVDKYISGGREIKRVVVGPFASIVEAKTHLQTVQEKIEPSSFVITTALH
jgi:cell division septation protein DedD